MEKNRLKTANKTKIAHDKMTPVQVLPFLHVQPLPKIEQATDDVLVPHEADVERADVRSTRVTR